MLQDQPGYVSRFIDDSTLDKYKVEGVFDRQGVNGFLLLNLEATLMIFLISIVQYVVLTILTKYVVPA